tara:strand:- start:2264 stop:3154 length:891 start_codon:yes stop_codon:yes gene_type:complete
MKITNKFNLPQPVVAALSYDSYNKGESHRSVTQLIDSPRIGVLRRKHDAELTEDVSQKLWSVLGTAVHNMFENATQGSSNIPEERYHYSHPDGWILSGAVDLTQLNHETKSGTLIDYKCTSVWSVIFEKQEWHNQLNAYAWLMRKANQYEGYKITELQIIAVLRDWKENDLKRNAGNYPEAPIKIINIPVWTDEKQDEYMEDRVKLHSDAEYAYLTGQQLPFCSEKEQWAKPEKFALHKGQAKRATRVFDDLAEAQTYQKKNDGLTLIRRSGDKTRCTANWCGVSEWCDQHEKESQ